MATFRSDSEGAAAPQGVLLSEDEVVAIAAFLLWCCLLVLCWPLALLAAALLPFVWLLSIPFRIFGVVLAGLLAFLKALFLLPARLLGHRPA